MVALMSCGMTFDWRDDPSIMVGATVVVTNGNRLGSR